MNAQELRIGNLVNVPREDQSPFRIDGFEFLFKDYAKVEMQVYPNVHPLTWELKDLSPIPLSPEWLEKCGKKCDPNSNWEYQINVGAIKWFFRWNTEWYSEIGGIYIDSRVQYLHQLQNLYYALTGTELVINH